MLTFPTCFILLPDPGDHECEVLGPGPVEMETHRAWIKCKKNPQHENFIRAEDFTMNHLPEGFRTDIHLGYVEYISKRTGRLRIGYVSKERPDTYTFAEFRGFKIPHTGTGWLNDVAYSSGHCVCDACTKSQNPKTGFCEVKIHTARHVVYNSEEAAHTQFDLFYEEGNSADGGAPAMMTLHGHYLSDVNTKRDLSTIVCISHEEQIVRKLITFQEEKEQMWKELSDNMALSVPKPTDVDACIIISHPHGKPKKITVGKLVRAVGHAGVSNLFDTYDTNTCKGSSGAPVIVWESGLVNPSPYDIPAPHSLGQRGGCSTSGGRPFFFG